MRRIRISLITLIGLCLSSVLGAQIEQDANILAQRAMQAQQASDYAQAANAWREVVKLQPDSVAAHVNLGVVLVNLGRYDEAIAEYEAADKLLPNDPRILLNTALAYEKSGRIAEARTRFESLHNSNPEDARITMLLADCRLQLGGYAGVVETLQPIAAREPDDLATAYMLGMALLKENRMEEGQKWLDRILRNGDTAEARFLLGTRMFESGDYPAAVKELAGAIELNPKLPGLQSLYGQALLNTGDPDGALAAFRAELAANPNDFEANLRFGQVLTVREQFTEAIPALQRALRARPDSTEAKLSFAECLTKTARARDARPIAESVAKAEPKSEEVHQVLAQISTDLHMAGSAAQERALAASLRIDSAPRVNDVAPDFTLPDSVTGKQMRLSIYCGDTPVVLIFGSYSCPNLRSSAEALKAMQSRFGAHIHFLLVYIREAHAGDQWQSSRNQREGVALAPVSTLEQKSEHARMCSRKLHLPFPAVVDGMDGAIEAAYHVWRSRAFIIGKNGRVSYSTRLTELDFRPEEMTAVLARQSQQTASNGNSR